MEKTIKDNMKLIISDNNAWTTLQTETPIRKKNESVAYVSDIHLEFLIRNNKIVEDKKIKDFIRKQRKKLNEEFLHTSNLDCDNYLLVAGDISSNFDYNKYFLDKVGWNLGNKKHCFWIYVLGNHELFEDNYEETVEKYRQYAKNKDLVIFLHNELYIPEYGIMNEREILEKSDGEIRHIANKNKVMVLGGIGFSGLNENKNSLNLNYGKTFNELREEDRRIYEKSESKRFEKIYTKLINAIPDYPVIVLTHMPKEDWSNAPYNSQWVYVSGHTHKNLFVNNCKKRVYADNQIGYKKKTIELKRFSLEKIIVNPFEKYNDGIYEITYSEYDAFADYKSISKIKYFEGNKYFVLKKKGYYMLFLEGVWQVNQKTKGFYLLAGAVPNLASKEDLNYYYDNMDRYADSVKRFMKPYFDKQQEISDAVKKIGGNGTCHGCIIDIDYFNHIYLDPRTGEIIPYYAEDTNSWLVYNSVEHLLKKQGLEDMEKGLLQLKRERCITEKNIFLPERGSKYLDNNEFVYYPKPNYSYSRDMCKFQEISENGIIKNWNKEILEIEKAGLNKVLLSE